MNSKNLSLVPNSSSRNKTKQEYRIPVDREGRFTEETIGERALWRAVITQALMDAGSNSGKRESRLDKAQAISWLSGRSRDFLMVCSLAQLEPEYVIERAKLALGRGCQWRNSNDNKQQDKTLPKVINIKKSLK